LRHRRVEQRVALVAGMALQFGSDPGAFVGRQRVENVDPVSTRSA
jgi:hypothetical protein